MVFKALAAARLNMSRSGAERSPAQPPQPVIQLDSTIKLTVALLSLLMATTGPVLAACGKSQRLDPKDVPCMDSGYKNEGYRHWNPKYYAWAKNLCTDKGRIVAKVDIASRKDLTWHIRPGKTRERKGDGYIRGIYYCKDISNPETKP